MQQCMSQKDRIVPHGEGEMEGSAIQAPLGKSKQLHHSVYISLLKYHLGCCYRKSVNLGHVFVLGVLESTAHYWQFVTWSPSPSDIF